VRWKLSPLLEDIVKTSGLPFSTTMLGKSIIGEDKPLMKQKWIGTFADTASTTYVLEQIQNTTCFLVLGALITDDYEDWIEKTYTRMIYASHSSVRINQKLYEGVHLNDFMAALLEKFRTVPPNQFTANRPSPWLQNSDPNYNNNPNAITFNRFFDKFMGIITPKLDSTILTFGVSMAFYVSTSAYDLRQDSYIASAAWQCTGFETGAALGAQLASHKRAWALAGDGGFMMVCQTLSTLSRYKQNAVIVVMNNGVYAIEEGFVKGSSFPGSHFEQFDILPVWDYKALAMAFDTNYYVARTMGEVEQMLIEIDKNLTDRPTLFDVHINKDVLPLQFKRVLNPPVQSVPNTRILNYRNKM